jgi:hypothetical protein
MQKTMKNMFMQKGRVSLSFNLKGMKIDKMKNKYNYLRDKLTSSIINLSHDFNNNVSIEDQETSSLEELAEILDEYLDLRSAESDGSSSSVH